MKVMIGTLIKANLINGWGAWQTRMDISEKPAPLVGLKYSKYLTMLRVL